MADMEVSSTTKMKQVSMRCMHYSMLVLTVTMLHYLYCQTGWQVNYIWTSELERLLWDSKIVSCNPIIWSSPSYSKRCMKTHISHSWPWMAPCFAYLQGRIFPLSSVLHRTVLNVLPDEMCRSLHQVKKVIFWTPTMIWTRMLNYILYMQ